MYPDAHTMATADAFPYADEEEWLQGLFTQGETPAHMKLERKRKSMEITPVSKAQLEVRRSSAGPVLTRSVSGQSVTSGPKRKRGRPRKYPSAIELETKEADCEIPLPEPFDFTEDALKENTDADLRRFLEQLLEEDTVGTARAAHGIPSPGAIKSMSISMSKNENKSKIKQESEPCEDEEHDVNKKRSKWTEAELLRLWQGIAKHGNNWTAIRGTCLGRSYCQIKDKGRRCLFLLGWETGRSKLETDSSSLHAKKIANAVLEEMK